MCAHTAIVDPNTNLKLWESGAIIQYLITQYDKEHKLSYTSLIERNQLNQWLMFQMSGQGPYFGQASWFGILHPEKIPSAIERYQNEVRRVLGVLDGALEGKDWLVGDKCTFADLAFVTWNDTLPLMGMGEDPLKEFVNVVAWHKRMTSRESFKTAMRKKVPLMQEQGLMPKTGMPKGVSNIADYETRIKQEEDGKQH